LIPYLCLMITIYCSQKLTTLLGLPKNHSESLSTETDLHDWNAILFYLNKRKCLLFMQKKTLYAFLALDIVKKDLIDFSRFFRQHLTDQLLADQLINPHAKNLLDSICDPISLMSTDNDRRIIGSMNDCIFRIRFYDSGKGDTLALSPTYIGHQLNRTPMKYIDYSYPVEKMKQYLTT
jgi:hypothetical protein